MSAGKTLTWHMVYRGHDMLIYWGYFSIDFIKKITEGIHTVLKVSEQKKPDYINLNVVYLYESEKNELDIQLG